MLRSDTDAESTIKHLSGSLYELSLTWESKDLCRESGFDFFAEYHSDDSLRASESVHVVLSRKIPYRVSPALLSVHDGKIKALIKSNAEPIDLSRLKITDAEGLQLDFDVKSHREMLAILIIAIPKDWKQKNIRFDINGTIVDCDLL